MQKIRYAVVGAGWISQFAFMPAVAQTGNSKLTAIISGSPTNAAKLAEFYSIDHIFNYKDYDQALSSGVFDAVYIALPNSMHAEYTIRAAKQGIHALVEKPLATSVEECELMIQAAEDNSVKLMTAYRLHCEPGTVEAIELVANGSIGSPRIFDSVFSLRSAASNHRLRREHWGGPLQDIGVYCLNAARHLFRAEPIAVQAMSLRSDDLRFNEVDEAVSATLRFPNDGLATFSVSFNGPDIDMYRIIGTKGEITMDPGFRLEVPTRLTWRFDNGMGIRESTNTDQFGAQTAYFSDCILADHNPLPDGYEGLADVRALVAIQKSAESSQLQWLNSASRCGHPSKETVRLIPRTDRRLVL